MRKQQRRRKGGFSLITGWIQGKDGDPLRSDEEKLVKREMQRGRMSEEEEEDEGAGKTKGVMEGGRIQGRRWSHRRVATPTSPSQLLMATEVSSRSDTCPV